VTQNALAKAKRAKKSISWQPEKKKKKERNQSRAQAVRDIKSRHRLVILSDCKENSSNFSLTSNATLESCITHQIPNKKELSTQNWIEKNEHKHTENKHNTHHPLFVAA
jgi:hypothetical protein